MHGGMFFCCDINTRTLLFSSGTFSKLAKKRKKVGSSDRRFEKIAVLDS